MLLPVVPSSSPATAPAFVDADGVGRPPRASQDRVTGAVLGAFFAVHRELGGGFAPEVYLRALALEFSQRGITAERDVPLSVFYRGTRVGQYRAPFVVADRVVVVVTAQPRLDVMDETVTRNALRAATCSAALLLNFGVAASFRHMER